MKTLSDLNGALPTLEDDQKGMGFGGNNSKSGMTKNERHDYNKNFIDADFNFGGSGRDEINEKALEMYEMEMAVEGAYDLGLQGPSRTALRTYCEEAVVQASTVTKRKSSAFFSTASSFDPNNDDTHAVSLLKQLQRERNIVARMGFTEKAHEIDRNIASVVLKAALLKKKEEAELLSSHMKMLSKMHEAKTQRLFKSLGVESSHLMGYQRKEYYRTKNRQRAEFMKVLENAERRAMGRIKKCNCTAWYLCTHNKTASYNTRRSTPQVILYKRNSKRLKKGGRTEDALMWEEKATDLDEEHQEKWRRDVAKSIARSPWGANEGQVDQLVQGHKNEMQVLQETQRVARQTLDEKHKMRKYTLNNFIKAEKSRLKVQVKKLYQDLLMEKEKDENILAALNQDEFEENMLDFDDDFGNDFENTNGTNFDFEQDIEDIESHSNSHDKKKTTDDASRDRMNINKKVPKIVPGTPVMSANGTPVMSACSSILDDTYYEEVQARQRNANKKEYVHNELAKLSLRSAKENRENKLNEEDEDWGNNDNNAFSEAENAVNYLQKDRSKMSEEQKREYDQDIDTFRQDSRNVSPEISDDENDEDFDRQLDKIVGRDGNDFDAEKFSREVQKKGGDALATAQAEARATLAMILKQDQMDEDKETLDDSNRDRDRDRKIALREAKDINYSPTDSDVVGELCEVGIDFNSDAAGMDFDSNAADTDFVGRTGSPTPPVSDHVESAINSASSSLNDVYTGHGHRGRNSAISVPSPVMEEIHANRKKHNFDFSMPSFGDETSPPNVSPSTMDNINRFKSIGDENENKDDLEAKQPTTQAPTPTTASAASASASATEEKPAETSIGKKKWGIMKNILIGTKEEETGNIEKAEISVKATEKFVRSKGQKSGKRKGSMSLIASLMQMGKSAEPVLNTPTRGSNFVETLAVRDPNSPYKQPPPKDTPPGKSNLRSMESPDYIRKMAMINDTKLSSKVCFDKKFILPRDGSIESALARSEAILDSKPPSPNPTPLMTPMSVKNRHDKSGISIISEPYDKDIRTSYTARAPPRIDTSTITRRASTDTTNYTSSSQPSQQPRAPSSGKRSSSSPNKEKRNVIPKDKSDENQKRENNNSSNGDSNIMSSESFLPEDSRLTNKSNSTSSRTSPLTTITCKASGWKNSPKKSSLYMNPNYGESNGSALHAISPGSLKDEDYAEYESFLGTGMHNSYGFIDDTKSEDDTI